MTTLSSFTRLSNLLMLGGNGEISRITDQKTFQFDLDLSRRFANYTPAYLREYAAKPDDHRFRIGIIYQSMQPKAWGAETLLFTDAVVHTLYPVTGSREAGLTTFQQKKRENSVYYGIELFLEYALNDSPGVPIFLPILFDPGKTLGDYANLLGETLSKEDANAPVIEVLNLIGPAAASRKNVEVFVALKEHLRNAFVKKDARKSVESKIMESMRTSSGSTSPAVTATEPPRQTPAASSLRIAPAGSISAPTAGATGTGSAYWYNAALHEAICDKLQKFLRPGEQADAEQVRHFVRFQELGTSGQRSLAASCPTYVAPAGSVLLEHGTADQWNLYLLEGDIELAAADGEKKVVSGASDKSRNAIAALKPRKFTVTALSRVRFLWLHDSIIAEIQQQQSGSKLTLV